jgi:chromate reductase, NAD(P)H dehydrogenase (quinone)
MKIKILSFCGSSRKGSLNQQLLNIAEAGAIAAGAEVTRLRLSDLRLPLYEGDMEAEYGLPEEAQTFKTMIAEHHAILIGTPEHNGGYTALLKNSIDWASRPTAGDPSGLAPFQGKPAALVSASPGAMGGLRSQIALQVTLNKIGVMVIPRSFALGAAHKAFDALGILVDSNAEKMVRDVGAALVGVTASLVQKSLAA